MLPRLAAALALFLVPLSAGASYTIDLIWSDSGTPTLTFSPFAFPFADAGACANGPGGAAQTFFQERCLEVRLTAAAPFKAAVISLGWNSGSSGTVLGRTGGESFGQFGSGPPNLVPVTPNVAGTGDCAGLGCDTAHGSFGGATPGITPAGVYTVGSISFDVSGVSPGMHDVIPFIRTGVGGAIDKQGNAAPIQLNGAVFNWIVFVPEPGTAGLLGLGLIALAARGRARAD